MSFRVWRQILHLQRRRIRMGNEVGINISEFDSNISTLQSNASELNSDMTITDEFEKTNIKPFTKDLEKAIEVKELLDKYQDFLTADSETLNKTGQDMVENDEHLAENTPAEMKYKGVIIYGA